MKLIQYEQPCVHKYGEWVLSQRIGRRVIETATCKKCGHAKRRLA